ncbi:MAG: IS4 family transposase [Phycisphaerae bacterium]|nr:IS4 family transposase [Phycisphaerae bacterium]
MGRRYGIDQAHATFVTRGKRNLQFQRRYSRDVDRSTGLRSDQTVILTGVQTSKEYPDPLRRVRYWDPETDKRFVFITNSFSLPALVVTQLYKLRWRVELFFKWIKQHLRIKVFYGTSANAVKTQLWIAICTDLLVAILKKELDLPHSLYPILQFLSVSIFKKTPISQAFSSELYMNEASRDYNQLLLFNL